MMRKRQYSCTQSWVPRSVALLTGPTPLALLCEGLPLPSLRWKPFGAAVAAVAAVAVAVAFAGAAVPVVAAGE